jgi:hypothetical protein
MTATSPLSPVLFHPGFLLKPLGWVLAAFAQPIADDPSLLIDLCSINKPRLHLLAIGALHAPKPIQPPLVPLLIRETPQEAMRRLGLSWPIGFSGVLHKLPDHVIEANLYRDLLNLLAEPAVAKFLAHRGEIDERIIRSLAALPTPLRNQPVFSLFADAAPMEHFARELQALAKQARMPFKGLVKTLAACRQRTQIIAAILNIVERLPLPDALPPRQVGPFQRVDHPDDIRALAKAWVNCLATYIHGVADGRTAIYLNDRKRPYAAALIGRHGRLGWLVEDIKGPANIEIEPGALAHYHRLFASQGVGSSEDLATIRTLMLEHRFGPH